MSEQTTNLSLPYIMAAQAQKHVTHNEALRKLDALVQISVEDRNLTTPPSAPDEGACYVVGTTATGDWAGKDGQLAAFQDGVWEVYPPIEGWTAWVKGEDLLIVFDGTDWVLVNAETVEKFGINATADTTNRLTVQSDAVLFNHDGAGVQSKLNKNAESETASVLFQTGFSGRAEFGTTGDDDFHVKVSPDGTTWKEAITIDKATAQVFMPQTSTFVFMLTARYYCYQDLRWVTSSDDLYGTAYYNASESGGVNTDPVVEWEHIGQYLKKGTKIHSIHQVGRANNLEVTDIEMYYLARYPSPVTRWETGIDRDVEMGIVPIHRDAFFNPVNGGVALTGDLVDMHKRKTDVDFVMPEDGFFSCYAKPMGTLTGVRTFASTLTVECSLSL